MKNNKELSFKNITEALEKILLKESNLVELQKQGILKAMKSLFSLKRENDLFSIIISIIFASFLLGWVYYFNSFSGRSIVVVDSDGKLLHTLLDMSSNHGLPRLDEQPTFLLYLGPPVLFVYWAYRICMWSKQFVLNNFLDNIKPDQSSPLNRELVEKYL